MLGYSHTRNYSFILYYIIWMSWYQVTKIIRRLYYSIDYYLKFLVSGTAVACMRIVYLSTGTSTLLPLLSWVNEGDWSWLVVFLYMYYTFISYMRVYEISIRRHTYNVCSSLFMNVAWQWCIYYLCIFKLWKYCEHSVFVSVSVAVLYHSSLSSLLYDTKPSRLLLSPLLGL